MLELQVMLIAGMHSGFVLELLNKTEKDTFTKDEVRDRMRNSPYWKELFMGFSQVSYRKMVFIPKPLKDEYWFSKEFIELLNKK